jgi:hypothetical protein
MGPTQPPIRWGPGALLPELKLLRREADHSPHQVPRLRISGGVAPHAYTPSGRIQGNCDCLNESYKTLSISIWDDIIEYSLLRHWMKEFLQAASRSNTVTMIAETETRFCGPKVLRYQKSGRQSLVITIRPTNTFLGIYNNRYKPDFRPEYGSFP